MLQTYSYLRFTRTIQSRSDFSLLQGLFEVANSIGFTIGRPLGGLLFYVSLESMILSAYTSCHMTAIIYSTAQVGGYMAPFLAVGSSAIIISIPCVLLVRKMGKVPNSASGVS